MGVIHSPSEEGPFNPGKILPGTILDALRNGQIAIVDVHDMSRDGQVQLP